MKTTGSSPKSDKELIKLRKSFIEFYKQVGDVTLTCKTFNISRPTFYKWYKRYDPENPSSLLDESKAPKTKRGAVKSRIPPVLTREPSEKHIPAQQTFDAEDLYRRRAHPVPKVVDIRPQHTPSQSEHRSADLPKHVITNHPLANILAGTTAPQLPDESIGIPRQPAQVPPPYVPIQPDPSPSLPHVYTAQPSQPPQTQTPMPQQNSPAASVPAQPEIRHMPEARPIQTVASLLKERLHEHPQSGDTGIPAPSTQSRPAHPLPEPPPPPPGTMQVLPQIPEPPPTTEAMLPVRHGASNKKQMPQMLNRFRNNANTLKFDVPQIKNPRAAIVIGVLLLLAVVIGLPYFLYARSGSSAGASADGDSPSTADIVKKVGAFMELPKDEDPTIATVTDLEKLKGQPFFQEAKKGDVVLIYDRAAKIILYDPLANKIINAASTNVETPTPTPAPVADKTYRIALLNGTDVTGLTKTVESDLLEKLDKIVVAVRDNADQKGYTKSLIIDLTGQHKDMANQLAVALRGNVSTMPEGETEPPLPEGEAPVDFLAIIGSDYVNQ